MQRCQPAGISQRSVRPHAMPSTQLQDEACCSGECQHEANHRCTRHAAVLARAAAKHAMRPLKAKAPQPPAKATKPDQLACSRSSSGRQHSASALQPPQQKEWRPVRQLRQHTVSTGASQQHSPAAGGKPAAPATTAQVKERQAPPVGASPWERLTNGVWDHIFAHLSIPALRNFRLVITTFLTWQPAPR